MSLYHYVSILDSALESVVECGKEETSSELKILADVSNKTCADENESSEKQEKEGSIEEKPKQEYFRYVCLLWPLVSCISRFLTSLTLVCKNIRHYRCYD